MTVTQRFTLAAEESTNSTEAGDLVAVAVLLDGRPVGALIARRVVDPGMTGEYVPDLTAVGLSIDRGRMTSIASGSNLRGANEPTPSEVVDAAINREAGEDAYGFVRWSDEGTEVPDHMPDGFYLALEAASAKFGRPIVDGFLTGAKRSW